MPRETVSNCDGGPWVPKVGWFPSGTVQIGVASDDGRSLFWLLLGHDTDALRRLGDQVRKMTQLAYDDDEHLARELLNTLDVCGSYNGLWADLDRGGCNQLIRHLRKARDTAFGKDE